MHKIMLALVATLAFPSLSRADCAGVVPYAFYTANLQGVLLPEPGQDASLPFVQCGDVNYPVAVYDAATIPESCLKLPPTITTNCGFSELQNTGLELSAVIITGHSDAGDDTAELRIQTKLIASGIPHYNDPYIFTAQTGPLKELGYDGTAFNGITLHTATGTAFTGYLHLNLDIYND